MKQLSGWAPIVEDGLRQLRGSDLNRRGAEMMEIAPEPCLHEYEFVDYCGAEVCIHCTEHKGLSRCFCGWAVSDDGLPGLRVVGEDGV